MKELFKTKEVETEIEVIPKEPQTKPIPEEWVIDYPYPNTQPPPKA
jgi:hypothetical protein